jgi:TPP-dependent trihydroxycyclohexane-1,2-dione (THcHDO) dehydratase
MPLELDHTFSASGVAFRHSVCTLDWRDIDPKPSVIRSVLGVAIDLLLDPLDCGPVGCCWSEEMVRHVFLYHSLLMSAVLGLARPEAPLR